MWRGLSIDDLARKAGLPAETIAAMDAGSYVQTNDEASRLAGALDVHVGWLEP